jgi:alanine dehydrogenase
MTITLMQRLTATDVLADATQRHDASVPLIRNSRLGLLPPHAVICDLVVDPYLLDADPPTVRGIEGSRREPRSVRLRRRRSGVGAAASGGPDRQPSAVVSCYSWPGVHPKRCMELYGKQLAPLLEMLVERGGFAGVRPDGSFHERAFYRGASAPGPVLCP